MSHSYANFADPWHFFAIGSFCNTFCGTLSGKGTEFMNK